MGSGEHKERPCLGRGLVILVCLRPGGGFLEGRNFLNGGLEEKMMYQNEY